MIHIKRLTCNRYDTKRIRDCLYQIGVQIRGDHKDHNQIIIKITSQCDLGSHILIKLSRHRQTDIHINDTTCKQNNRITDVCSKTNKQSCNSLFQNNKQNNRNMS